MRNVLLLLVGLCTHALQAQVGIGTTTPQGALDIVSTNDTGVVIPRVSSTANVTDGQGNPPANGTLVYDISKRSICFYLNQNWACIAFQDQGQVGIENSNDYYTSQQTYFKASNTEAGDRFGSTLSISADGKTLAVGAYSEDSNATGVNGDQTNNSTNTTGAVYVFIKNAGVWSQQAYIKASNTEAGDRFGEHLSLSADGNTLAVGANREDSNATGINGNQADNSAIGAGAAYVFSRSGITWSQQAYIKASNTESNDLFGEDISLSGDGNTLAVGAYAEASIATGINGNQADNSAATSGAVYVFSRSGVNWTQQAYIKASNAGFGDRFGEKISLNSDGNTLAVSARYEDSSAIGINGNQADNSAAASGAVYVFNRSGVTWTQQAYIKTSNTEAGDNFGRSVSISGIGDTLVVGAENEDSNARGIDGDQMDNTETNSGAAYVFTRAGATWTQQAYIKASNTTLGVRFGASVSISEDGNTIAASANFELSDATGVDGDQTNSDAPNSGATYVYAFIDGAWFYKSYIKATNTQISDRFGESIGLSSDGGKIVIGTSDEDSNATGVNGNQTNNSAPTSGAVYMYEN